MAFIDTIYQGAAIFSTHFGQFERRDTLPPSIILRSNPNDDEDEMIDRLRRMFPEQCKLITDPVDVAYYFDVYDMHRHGFVFLQTVLQTIARHNFTRASHVRDFAHAWINANPHRFEDIMWMKYEVFAETADREHGEEFSKDVYRLLQDMRAYGPPASKSGSPRL